MRGRSIISSPGGVPLLGWGRIRDNLYRVHRVSLSDGGYRAACGAAMVDTGRRGGGAGEAGGGGGVGGVGGGAGVRRERGCNLGEGSV